MPPLVPDGDGILWVDSLIDLLNCLLAAIDGDGQLMGLEGVRCIRLSKELTSRRCPPDTDAQFTLGPPPFHREAAAPIQEEAQRHMAREFEPPLPIFFLESE